MTRRWHGFGVIDVLYGGTFVVAVVQGRPSGGVHLAMALFAWFVLLVNWGETRRLVGRPHRTRRSTAWLVGLCLLTLGVWYVLATLSPERLALYFALFGMVFALQAVRDVVLLGRTPVDLLMQGNVSLVAVCLVLGAVADALQQYEVALVTIAFLVFFVRKLFRWTAVAIDWYVTD